MQQEVLPFLLLTRSAERLYAKPRGYAGDYLSIDWIYNDQAGGTGRARAATRSLLPRRTRSSGGPESTRTAGPRDPPGRRIDIRIARST